jgi:hypothetical protein
MSLMKLAAAVNVAGQDLAGPRVDDPPVAGGPAGHVQPVLVVDLRPTDEVPGLLMTCRCRRAGLARRSPRWPAT